MCFCRLLTVLNFVDDSPILLFTRAIALGYSSGGDPKTCLDAYPLCPKDSDQLVNYLNNHNGGFFRFFNHQQLLHQPQYAPQYQQFLQKTYDQRNSSEIRSGSTNRNQLVSRFHKNKGFTSRILNDPIDILEIAHTDDAGITLSNVPPKYGIRDDYKKKIIFRPASHHQWIITDKEQDFKAAQSSRIDSRKGKKFSFPEQSISSSSDSGNVMIFPDRTGTGNLILKDGFNDDYKIVFVDEQRTQPHRFLRSHHESKVKFSSDENDNDNHDEKYFNLEMRFPREK